MKNTDKLNRKPDEMSAEELAQVTGGGKDQYENVILGVNPEEHNVMLGSKRPASMNGKEYDEQVL